MKREFLTGLALETEVIDKIMAEHGKTVNDIKSKQDEKNEEVKILKEKVTSLEKTAKDTETLVKDNEDLKSKYSSLQEQSKKELETKDKQISHITKKTALSKALKDKGARYPELLIKELDLDTVELDGENIKNFDNLYTPLADKYKDMFTVTEVQGNDPQRGQQSNYDISNMDLSFMDNIK
jgi:hypothetical protein